jgi:cytidylate kinase
MDKRAPVIAIDGTCASGKGTVAQTLASVLGFYYLNSGAIYRKVAFLALEKKIDLSSERSVVKIAQQFLEHFRINCKASMHSMMDDPALYTEKVALAASQIAIFPTVRALLLDCQKAFQCFPGLVAEGRDMGTQVFQEASLKIYLSADLDQRALRRYEQLLKQGESVTLALVREDIQKRDYQDMQRSFSPLAVAKEAYLLDSSRMTVEEVVAQILQKWRKIQKIS